MYMESAIQVLRGWPGEGALDRAELIKQGSNLTAGDVVEMQPDGTVDLVGSTATRAAGLVLRGNLDDSSAANSYGRFMTPQPVKTITDIAWASGIATATLAGHGYKAGNIVTISSSNVTGSNPDGNRTILAVTADTFTFAMTATTGTFTAASAKLISEFNTAGQAVVLWGSYIVQTQNYAAGNYIPGSSVTAKSGKFALATAATQSGTTPFAVTAGDPVVGHVLRVQGAVSGVANKGETAHLVIVVY